MVPEKPPSDPPAPAGAPARKSDAHELRFPEVPNRDPRSVGIPAALPAVHEEDLAGELSDATALSAPLSARELPPFEDAVTVPRGERGEGRPAPAEPTAVVSAEPQAIAGEPADIEPADIGPADIGPADIEPADIEPADIEPITGDLAAPELARGVVSARAAVADAAAFPRAPAAPASASTEPLETPLQIRGWVALFVITASLVMVLWNMQTRSIENANTGSRYATIESLVDHGTYNIDASRYSRTPDKVKARGHWVSSKPPLLPTYGAGIYWVIKKLTGYTIAEHEGVVVWTVGVFTGWLSHLVFLLYFYRLSCLLLRRQLAILVALAAAGFAYLGTAYGTAINNHSVGGALQVMGFYYAYRARNESPSKPRHWLAAGLVLGVLPAFDLPSLAFLAFTGVYLLTKNWKWALLLFTPAALPGLALEPLLAHAATGSWLPAYSDATLKNYAGNYFRHASGIDALKEPKLTYAFNMLLGHHGLFSMTPLFLFSLFELVRRFVKRERFRAEVAVWIATLVAFLAFYIRGTTNYGGWCVGMRWLVPVMPWLLMLFALWLDRARLSWLKKTGVVAAFVVSAYNVQDGLSSPFQFSVWHNWLENAPNRNRLGPTWNLARTAPAKAKTKKPADAKKPVPKKR